MNDDIYPVTPRITDPDLRPRDHYTGSNVGSSRAYGDSHSDNLIEFEDDDLGAKRPKQGAKTGAESQSNGSSGFNVFGFNLTYKHIIIIVLVIIALLIVIYLVVNWLRKPSPNEPLPPPQQPQRQPQRAGGAPGGATGRQNADAARSAAELAALMQQTQNKLDELNDDGANDTTESEKSVATTPVVEAPPAAVSAQTETITTPSLNTHMDVPQEQIDNILSTEEDA